ncbi:hypothetical protein F5Y16DRAFT_385992 [Xylariaceae sp. FL0255]|nr:hypothetical protein F5Y16DRAFT_385992 [Xylariaceae sp. FL0255]
MVADPEPYANDAPSLIEDDTGVSWTPLFWKSCTFDSKLFAEVMNNFIRNPNLNSSWLFRADILFEQQPEQTSSFTICNPAPIIVRFSDFDLKKVLIRKLIPRNPKRDEPLDQTCLFYHGHDNGNTAVSRSMVIYKPHSTSTDMPFYHPIVQGIAFLHEWNSETGQGTASIHYQYFNDVVPIPKLARTGLHLLSTLVRHGEGRKNGYVKRVHHDTLTPQATFQSTYTRLKQTYAQKLIETWAETTDPEKHCFEDLSIAAFLIELWAQMYKECPFPGFVDIGCGNGLLVYILRKEGYSGWGMDARKRKSWENYAETLENSTDSSLRELVLLPSILEEDDLGPETLDSELRQRVHNGVFPRGTFIISNHGDELTPWTPILATVSDCPFIMIPCCSHDLSGARFRAAPPKDKSKGSSAYASLVEWVKQLALDCNWAIETEMLRIPSTRNTGIIGRRRCDESVSVDIPSILRKYGGTGGYVENVIKLMKTPPKGH